MKNVDFKGMLIGFFMATTILTMGVAQAQLSPEARIMQLEDKISSYAAQEQDGFQLQLIGLTVTGIGIGMDEPIAIISGGVISLAAWFIQSTAHNKLLQEKQEKQEWNEGIEERFKTSKYYAKYKQKSQGKSHKKSLKLYNRYLNVFRYEDIYRQ